MSRVLVFDQDVVNNLNQIDVYNKILGHHKRIEGVMKFYPKNGGSGALINHLIEKIENVGVVIKTNTSIKEIIINQKNISKIITSEGEYECDRVIWSVPLIFLANLAKINRQSVRPVFRNTTLFDFSFTTPLNTDCCFINVYEPSMQSARITVYQNLGADDKAGFSCTVEVLSDQSPAEEVILDELMKMGLIEDVEKCCFKQTRKIKNGFPILTCEYSKISKENNKYYREQFDNVMFIGRASEDAFFMTDVLRDTHTKVMSL
jgi:protoporphyrinogen oxidase